MPRPLRLLSIALLFSGACVDSFNPFPGADGGPERDALGADTNRADVPDIRRDSGPACAPLPPACDPEAYLEEACGTSTCHGAGQQYEGSRYEGGDVFGRLVGLPSGQHGGGGRADCASIPVIDPVDASNSMLLRTLRATQGVCGDRMPFDGTASPQEIECLESWIEREACLRYGDDVGVPGTDAGGPGPDAGPPSLLEPDRDPGPLTAEEAACLGVDASPCSACHVYRGVAYRFPYWAPEDPTPRPPNPPEIEACSIRDNRLSAAAVECLELNNPACSGCHTAGDDFYLRPWNGTSSPPGIVTPSDCSDLL